MTDRSLSATPSNPDLSDGMSLSREAIRDGDVAPSDWALVNADWRIWFMRAHRAWARKHAPWLLQEWHDA